MAIIMYFRSCVLIFVGCRSWFSAEQSQDDYQCSVAEVEVVISVVVIFALAEAGADEVEGNGEPRNSEPDAETVVDDNTVDEESLEATVHEMEEPLLGGVGAMVPDVASCESALLIEVLLTVPCAVLHLWYSKTFTICKSHVLHVAEFVVGESTSCKRVG